MMNTDGIAQMRHDAQHYRDKAAALQMDIERVEDRFDGDYDAMPTPMLETMCDAQELREDYLSKARKIEHDLDYPARAAEVVHDLEQMLAQQSPEQA